MILSIWAETPFDSALPDFLRFGPGVSKVVSFDFTLLLLLSIETWQSVWRSYWLLLSLEAWGQREVHSLPQAPCCFLRLQEF